VVDSKRRLLGTVTDGDIRRVLLQGKGLEVKLSVVMHPKALVMKVGTPIKWGLLGVRS